MKLNVRKIALLLFPALSVFTASGQTITLDSIIGIIKRNNPMLQEYQFREQALNEMSKGAKAWMAPMIGGGTFMTPYPGQTVMEERDKGSFMISAEQSIPNPAKLRANKQLLSSRAEIEKAAGSFAFNNLRAQARSAYFEWIVLEKKLKILKENQAVVTLMLDISKSRYPYNQSSLGTTFKTEGRLHEVANMIYMTENEIRQKNISLNTLMKLPKETRYRIDTAMTEFQPVAPQVDTVDLARNRSDVRQVNKQIESMQYELQLERLQSKPDFKIRYNHMAPIGRQMPGVYTIEGMVSIPIAPWSSKMYRANAAGTHFQIQAMKRGREAILNETQGMVAGMAWEIETGRKQLDAYQQKIIPALKRNYESIMLAYQENKSELLFVIDAYEALLMAQIQYLDALKKYYQMIVAYERELEV